MLLVQLLLPIDWKCNYKPSYYLFRALIANESSLLEKQTITYNKISGRTIEITRSDFSENSNNPTEKLVQKEEYAQASVTTGREEIT